MLRALLVEDEPLAARRLTNLLQRQAEPFEILGPAESVAQAVALLQAGPAPDVLFLDIHLADGLSFELFEQVRITCPVIFTTAYDQYALRAFKVNSVDYLLKPIDEEELRGPSPSYAPGSSRCPAQCLRPWRPRSMPPRWPSWCSSCASLRPATKRSLWCGWASTSRWCPSSRWRTSSASKKRRFCKAPTVVSTWSTTRWSSSKACSTRLSSSVSTAPTWPGRRPSTTSFTTPTRACKRYSSPPRPKAKAPSW
ncbi:response regulator [Hymenobacter sp. BRD67]|nr:response regulator [Hymenobacter sp. BRD67]